MGAGVATSPHCPKSGRLRPKTELFSLGAIELPPKLTSNGFSINRAVIGRIQALFFAIQDCRFTSGEDLRLQVFRVAPACPASAGVFAMGYPFECPPLSHWLRGWERSSVSGRSFRPHS
jgi:hypothetical protein